MKNLFLLSALSCIVGMFSQDIQNCCYSNGCYPTSTVSYQGGTAIQGNLAYEPAYIQTSQVVYGGQHYAGQTHSNQAYGNPVDYRGTNQSYGTPVYNSPTVSYPSNETSQGYASSVSYGSTGYVAPTTYSGNVSHGTVSTNAVDGTYAVSNPVYQPTYSSPFSTTTSYAPTSYSSPVVSYPSTSYPNSGYPVENGYSQPVASSSNYYPSNIPVTQPAYTTASYASSGYSQPSYSSNRYTNTSMASGSGFSSAESRTSRANEFERSSGKRFGICQIRRRGLVEPIAPGRDPAVLLLGPASATANWCFSR